MGYFLLRSLRLQGGGRLFRVFSEGPAPLLLRAAMKLFCIGMIRWSSIREPPKEVGQLRAREQSSGGSKLLHRKVYRDGPVEEPTAQPKRLKQRAPTVRTENERHEFQSRQVAGIRLIPLLTVEFGGASILSLLIGDPAYTQNELRQDSGVLATPTPACGSSCLWWPCAT
jgi:hypothetical protein